jgi:very-short-patch-repair endonuclease
MSGTTIAFRAAGATKRARFLRREETDAEYRLWRRLSGRELGGYKFVRQAPLGSYVVDFLCRSKRLVVEIDGEQHAGREKDSVRTAFLNQNGYSVLRFWNFEVLREREAVLDAILAVLEGQLAGPSDGLRYAPGPSPGRLTPTRPLPSGERRAP